MKSTLAILATAATLAAAAGTAQAATVVTGLNDTLDATPMHYAGHCPGVITFHGTVVVSGHIDPGGVAEIGYQFTRSDGATGQNQYIEAHHTGVYHITETWTLGGPQLHDYAGWEKFKAWPTADIQNKTGNTWSNEARFTLKCGG